MNYQVMQDAHPAADIFPLMPEGRLKELADDIAKNGLREPISLLDGLVIDGRNRTRACAIAGVQPAYKSLPEEINPWSFVWSLNGQRRDLTSDQRYILWGECTKQDAAWAVGREKAEADANSKRAEATNSRERNDDGTLASGATTCGTIGKKNRTTDTKATASGVDRGTVERNEWLAKHRPDLHGKVRTGALTSSKARNIAKKETRAADLEKQRAEIEAGTAELPVGVFEVVVMDPPWAYPGEYDPVGNRSAIPYPPMEQNELSVLNPPLADDAVMFLWTTHQFIWDAKDLLDQWGLHLQSEFCLG